MLVNDGQMSTFIQMEGNNKIKSVSILGCGWLGMTLAEELVARGVSVNGSTTTHEKKTHLSRAGISPFIINLNKSIDEELLLSFLNSEILYVNVPPSKAVSDENRYVEAFDQLIALLPKTPIRKVLFISATSVYKDVNGVVDEASQLSSSDRAIRLLEAESRFLSLSKIDVTIIRFGGLCGNGRNPITVLSGKKAIAGGNQKVNMIHVEDCVDISIKFMHTKSPGCYNAVSDEHPIRALFYSEMANLYQLKSPTYIDADKPTMGKAISSQKLKKALSYTFHYPDPLKFPN